MRISVFLCVLGAVLASAAARAQSSDILTFNTLYKRVVSSTDASTTNSETFETFTSTEAFALPNGISLITVRFSAESRCSESSTTTTNWCEVRILVDGQEAEPVETISGQDFAFDSTDGGAASAGNYAAHAMDRHLCVDNTGGPFRLVPVEVQRKVTNLDGGAAPSFWLDDYTLTVEASAGCFPL